MIGEIEFEKLVWGQILGLQSLFHMPSFVQHVRDRLPSCGYGTSSLTWRRQGPHPHTYRLPRSCWVNGAGRPQRRGCLGGPLKEDGVPMGSIHSPTFSCNTDSRGLKT